MKRVTLTQRNRWKFSLRTLALVPVILAPLLAWLGLVTRQQRIVSTLVLAGAFVARSNHEQGEPTGIWKAFDTRAIECVAGVDSDDLASRTSRLSEVKFIVFRGGVTDIGIAHIEGLRSLESVAIIAPAVTDAALPHLAKLPNLTSLTLNGASITDAGLEQLIHFRQLRDLAVMNCGITDSGMKHLGQLTELRALALKGTKVTDKGLASLCELRGLQRLDVRGTDITLNGAAHVLPVTTTRPGNNTRDLAKRQWRNEGVQRTSVRNCQG